MKGIREEAGNGRWDRHTEHGEIRVSAQQIFPTAAKTYIKKKKKTNVREFYRNPVFRVNILCTGTVSYLFDILSSIVYRLR